MANPSFFGSGGCRPASQSPIQARLRRFPAGCVVVSLGEAEAHDAGRLLGITGTADVVDAAVVAVALRRKALIRTGGLNDIQRLVLASGREITVISL